MGTFFGFQKSTASPRREYCDAERRTTKGESIVDKTLAGSDPRLSPLSRPVRMKFLFSLKFGHRALSKAIDRVTSFFSVEENMDECSVKLENLDSWNWG